MPKKCPFLKLGATPAGKVIGNQQSMVLVVGNCMGEECALYIIKEDGVIDKSECALTMIAKGTIL